MNKLIDNDAKTHPLILVVDDSRTTRLMLSRLLEKEGWQVIEAENGREGIEAFLSHNPAVILMDIQMPVLDGLSACAQIKKLPSGQRAHVLMFTGLEDQKIVENAFHAGAADFINKPINHEELIYRVKRLFYLQSIEDKLQHQAFYDTLTELPNRFLFYDRLSTAISHAQKEGCMLAAIFLNLRNFKVVNSAFGYKKGDMVLKNVAERLKNTFRGEVTVSRYSGDHFALMLPAINQEDEVVKAAAGILESFKTPWIIDGQEIRISCNLGISLYPNDGHKGQDLVQNAENAMFQAMELGSNTYKFYDREISARAYERVVLENSLTYALERRELLLYYQPQVGIDTGKIIGVEALLRWQHPEKGMISPGDFIPLADETGLIVPIGEWVVSTACAQNRVWQDKGLSSLEVSVNLSARQFQQEDLVQVITHGLKKTNFSPRLLKLEITESLAMQDIDFTIRTLAELKKLGINISIDDFGTGYSSLNYLRRLPIDELKIDRSFIKDITTDPDAAAVVEIIILLAKKLNLTVVAEGVETAEQFSFLKEKKCDVIQGYYISKPLPFHECEKLLQRGQA